MVAEPLGLYCHVPFCPLTCDFCAFHQQKPYRKDVTAFLEGVKKELLLYPEVKSADTIYFGGGTPGLLSTKDLTALCETFAHHLNSPPEEWTVEMAPSTVKADKIQALMNLGVTRISMGVQSFNEDLLGKMGRPHTKASVLKAYETIRSEGFENVNLDLIFAVPGQTMGMLEEDLEKTIRLAPEHISTYCLTYEEDTPLWHALCKGQVRRDVDEEADLYVRTWEILQGAGYEQYEISNFALPGHACVHNLNTWKMHQWIGIGPSAASQYHGVRRVNPAGMKEWIEGGPAEKEVLSPRILLEDAILFGLRMSKGVNPPLLEQRFEGMDLSFLEPLWRNLEEEGLMESNLSLTLKGKLLADRIAVEVMAAFDTAYIQFGRSVDSM